MEKKSPKIVKLDINEEDMFSGVDAIALVESPAIEAGWMFFSDQKFETYADYGEKVRANAKNAVDWAEENGWGSCGTDVGKQRAHQLAKGEAISLETIKRMYSYLSRHEGDLDSSTSYNEGCGKLMYDAWGGKAGLSWSRNKLRELGEGDFAELPDYVNEPSGSLIVKDIFVKPSAGESEDDFLGRCIPTLINEGKDQDQAAAICYSYWREGFDGKVEGYLEELFDFLGYVDELPVYSTAEEAMEVAKVAGCEGYHEHQLGDLIVYMPCQSHEDGWDTLLEELYNEYKKSKKRSWSELDEEQKVSLLDYLDKVAVDAPDSKGKFNTIKTSDIKSAGRNFGDSFLDTPTTKLRYQYDGPVDSKNRDFCRVLMTRYTQQGKVFRKEDINNMSFAGVNTGFGPNGIDEYNIFLYRGGNNCRHEWKQVVYTLGSDGDWMNSTKEVSAIAELQKIIAPRNPQTELGVIETPLGIGTEFSAQKFADQQIVAGPFMIPNKLIYRKDESGEYYVYFSEETIKKIAYKYMQNKYTDSTNLEHMTELSLNDVFVVESWLIDDPKRDKSLIYSGGDEYPKGTWYGLMKVKNKEVWENYVKSGMVKGFSVEGFFIDELLNKTKV